MNGVVRSDTKRESLVGDGSISNSGGDSHVVSGVGDDDVSSTVGRN